MYAVIHFEMETGFVLYGPFDTERQAEAWRISKVATDDWTQDAWSKPILPIKRFSSRHELTEAEYMLPAERTRERERKFPRLRRL